MRDWLLRRDFVLHSGAKSFFKIEWEVIGVPRGGIRIANALQKYCMRWSGIRLIVDDVLTTGQSMERAKEYHSDIGVVLFAREPCPQWVNPVFRLWD